MANKTLNVFYWCTSLTAFLIEHLRLFYMRWLAPTRSVSLPFCLLISNTQLRNNCFKNRHNYFTGGKYTTRKTKWRISICLHHKNKITLFVENVNYLLLLTYSYWLTLTDLLLVKQYSTSKRILPLENKIHNLYICLNNE